MRDICRYAWVCDKHLSLNFRGAPYRHLDTRKDLQNSREDSKFHMVLLKQRLLELSLP